MCELSIKKKTPFSEHNLYWSILTPSTCSQEGSEKGECLYCDYETMRVTSKSSHNYLWVVTTKPISCEDYGIEKGTCADCGDITFRQILGHSYDWSTTKEPTCSEYGEEKGICTICYSISTRAIPKTEHNYVENTLVKPSTCSEKGMIADVCSSCNHTINYQLLDKLEHEFSNFYCLSCHEIDSQEYVSTDFDIGQKTSNIKTQLATFGIDNDTLNNTSLTSFYLNNKNNLVIGFTQNQKEYSFSFPNVKDDYSVSQTNSKTICEISFSSDFGINILYADQTLEFCGNFVGENPITHLFINQNNNLIAVYKSLQLYNLGIVSKSATNLDEGSLIYQKISGKEEYAVVGAYEQTGTTITIPATHNGLPVTEIAFNAFEGNNTIKTVILGENIKTVNAWAFWKCTNLEEVYLNDSIELIRSGVFYRTKLKTIYFNGNRENVIIKQAYNDILFTDIWQKYE